MKKGLVVLAIFVVLIGIFIGLNTVKFTVHTVENGFVLMTMDENEEYFVEFERTEQDVKIGDTFYGIHKVPFFTCIWGYDGDYVPDNR